MCSLRRLIEAFSFEIDLLATSIAARLVGHGYTAIQAIGGVGPVLAAAFVAEIGEGGPVCGHDIVSGHTRTLYCSGQTAMSDDGQAITEGSCHDRPPGVRGPLPSRADLAIAS